MRTRIVYEQGDEVRYTSPRPIRVNADLSAFVGSRFMPESDEIKEATVLFSFVVKKGWEGEVTADDGVPDNFVQVLFKIHDVPFNAQVSVLVRHEVLELLPEEEKPVSTIKGDTFTAHGEGPGK